MRSRITLHLCAYTHYTSLTLHLLLPPLPPTPIPAGKVVVVNVDTLAVERELINTEWIHPTSLVIHGGIAYIAEQQLGHIYKVNVTTGESLGYAVTNMQLPNAGPLEGIALSDC